MKIPITDACQQVMNNVREIRSYKIKQAQIIEVDGKPYPCHASVEFTTIDGGTYNIPLAPYPITPDTVSEEGVQSVVMLIKQDLLKSQKGFWG